MYDWKRLQQIDEDLKELLNIRSLIIRRYEVSDHSEYGSSSSRLECDVLFRVEYISTVLIKLTSKSSYSIQDAFSEFLLENVDREISKLNKEKNTLLGIEPTRFRRLIKFLVSVFVPSSKSNINN